VKFASSVAAPVAVADADSDVLHEPVISGVFLPLDAHGVYEYNRTHLEVP